MCEGGIKKGARKNVQWVVGRSAMLGSWKVIFFSCLEYLVGQGEGEGEGSDDERAEVGPECKCKGSGSTMGEGKRKYRVTLGQGK